MFGIMNLLILFWCSYQMMQLFYPLNKVVMMAFSLKKKKSLQSSRKTKIFESGEGPGPFALQWYAIGLI